MRLTILAILLTTSVIAQEAKYTITTNDGAVYKAKSYNSKVKKFKFTVENGKEKEISYGELKSIKFVRKINRRSKPLDVELRFVRISERNGILMRILKEGRCNLYVHEFNYLHYYVLRDGEQIATPIYLKQIISNNFKKTALEYFDDCKEVTDRIKKKKFWKKNIPEMVEYYNNNCVK